MASHELLGDQIRSIALEGLLGIRSQVTAVGELTGNSQDSTLPLVDGKIRDHLQEINLMVLARRKSLEGKI